MLVASTWFSVQLKRISLHAKIIEETDDIFFGCGSVGKHYIGPVGHEAGSCP